MPRKYLMPQASSQAINQANRLTQEHFRYLSGLQDVSERTEWLFRGSGDPEGVVTAPVGALFLRSDGGAGSTLYVKESGDMTKSGWAAK